MGKLIYSMKIIRLSTEIEEQFPKGEILSRQHLMKLEQFVVFAVSVYVQWWLVSPLAASAPVHETRHKGADKRAQGQKGVRK